MDALTHINGPLSSCLLFIPFSSLYYHLTLWCDSSFLTRSERPQHILIWCTYIYYEKFLYHTKRHNISHNLPMWRVVVVGGVMVDLNTSLQTTTCWFKKKILVPFGVAQEFFIYYATITIDKDSNNWQARAWQSSIYIYVFLMNYNQVYMLH